jgi:hypothetical protein
VAAIHAVLLLLLFFSSIARTARLRSAGRGAIATFRCSPTPRACCSLPSAAQHLLAVLGVAITVHETLAGRWWTAALAHWRTAHHDSACSYCRSFPRSHARTKRMREALLWAVPP